MVLTQGVKSMGIYRVHGLTRSTYCKKRCPLSTLIREVVVNRARLCVDG